MDIAQIVESFQHRTSWSTTKEIFQMCELSTGQGWEKTILKLIEEQSIDEDNNFIDKIKLLQEKYEELLLINNKAVRLYSLKRAILDEWISAFESYDIESTVFHKTYPYPLDKERLENVNLSPKLVEIQNNEDSLRIIFCTKRVSVEREEIKRQNLSKENIEKYNKVVGVKEVFRQYFDTVILLKKENRVEVRIDMTTGSSSSKDLPSKEIDKAFYQILKSFNELAKKLTKLEASLYNSINVFPLIDRLYESSEEGKVVELDFATDEGSIKHAKMRRKSVDLRKELFHSAGKSAVSHINSYRLLISWDYQLTVDLSNELELLLPGSIKELSEVPSYLGHFHIKNCICIEEYDFILGKVLTYLRKL